MKITIITSTLNCKDEVIKTAKSIRSVFSCNIQWIIIDGGSSDGTLEYLNSQADIIDTLVSEQDSGIYDAWNKSIKYISGDWVVFLGAGDELLVPGFNEMRQKIISDTEFRTLYYGNVILVDKNDTPLKKFLEIDNDDLRNGRPALPCHQGVFQHKSLFKNDVVFDSSYKIAADSKFLLNAIENSNILYVDVDVSNMEYLGVSTNPKHILKVRKEVIALRNELNITIPLKDRFIYDLRIYSKYFIGGVLNLKLKPRNNLK